MVEYAASPTEAVQRILEASLPGDIVICMGAGDIDGAIRKAI
jgi:UDP-N-acetylmuramate-alanine ligase